VDWFRSCLDADARRTNLGRFSSARGIHTANDQGQWAWLTRGTLFPPLGQRDCPPVHGKRPPESLRRAAAVPQLRFEDGLNIVKPTDSELSVGFGSTLLQRNLGPAVFQLFLDFLGFFLGDILLYRLGGAFN
jgi:hypothetical protein